MIICLNIRKNDLSADHHVNTADPNNGLNITPLISPVFGNPNSEHAELIVC